MCRYFPKGCDIYQVDSSVQDGIRICAAGKDGNHTVALVNYSSDDMNAELTLPYTFSDARVYVYEESLYSIDSSGVLTPASTGITGTSIEINVPAQSLVLLTDMD